MLKKISEEEQKKKKQGFTLINIKFSDRPIGIKSVNIIPGPFTGVT